MIEAFPWDTAPKYLLRDRDGTHGADFVGRVEGMGIEQVVFSARSPWQNPYVERLIGSTQRECLEHVIIISERQLRGGASRSRTPGAQLLRRVLHADAHREDPPASRAAVHSAPRLTPSSRPMAAAAGSSSPTNADGCRRAGRGRRHRKRRLGGGCGAWLVHPIPALRLGQDGRERRMQTRSRVRPAEDPSSRRRVESCLPPTPAGPEARLQGRGAPWIEKGGGGKRQESRFWWVRDPGPIAAKARGIFRSHPETGPGLQGPLILPMSAWPGFPFGSSTPCFPG